PKGVSIGSSTRPATRAARRRHRARAPLAQGRKTTTDPPTEEISEKLPRRRLQPDPISKKRPRGHLRADPIRKKRPRGRLRAGPREWRPPPVVAGWGHGPRFTLSAARGVEAMRGRSCLDWLAASRRRRKPACRRWLPAWDRRATRWRAPLAAGRARRGHWTAAGPPRCGRWCLRWRRQRAGVTANR